MAIVKVNPETGELNLTSDVRGKIGNVVFRQVNGKIVISAAPLPTGPSQKPGCISARRRFKNTVMFAKFLNAIPEIREVWKRAEYEGFMPYNKIIKCNVNNMEQSGPSVKNTITPPDHHFTINDVVFIEDNISILAEVDTEFDEYYKLMAVISVSEPADPDFELFKMMQLSVDHSAGEFTMKMSDDQLKICSSYKSFIMYLAILRNRNNEMEWSDTFIVQGGLEFTDAD